MTKDEYIRLLMDQLNDLSESEQTDITEYVTEYFEEAGSQQALEDLGSPEKYARQIRADLITQIPITPPAIPAVVQGSEPAPGRIQPDSKPETGNLQESRQKIWILILGILSLPVSLPLALMLICLIFMGFLLLFMLLLLVGMLFLAGVFSAVLLIWRFVALITNDPAGALYVLGALCVACGLSSLTLAALLWLFRKGIPWCAARLAVLYRSLKERIRHHEKTR